MTNKAALARDSPGTHPREQPFKDIRLGKQLNEAWDKACKTPQSAAQQQPKTNKT
jgi:hypothetical protein